MNGLNKAFIKTRLKLSTNLGGLVFSSIDGIPYVKVGADSPRPFSILSETHEVLIENRKKTYTYQLLLPQKGKYYLVEDTTFIGGTNSHSSTYEDYSISGSNVTITPILENKPSGSPTNAYTWTRLIQLDNDIPNNTITVTLVGTGSDSTSFKTIKSYVLLN